ncbi:MAG: NAD-dependent epimerase/dehydratase family protein [Candidatus Hodarchaeota archaeon]
MDLKNKKILVTGGTGFLGSNIIDHLVRERGIPAGDIHVFYLKDSPTNALDDIDGLNFFSGNILDVSSIQDALNTCQIVFHTVGNTTFDPFKRKIQWLVNVEGTRNIIESCLKSPTFEKIVHTSTVNTLGAPYPVGSLGDENTSPYEDKTRSVHSFDSVDDILHFADGIHDEALQGKWWKRYKVGYHDSKLAAQEIVNRAFEENELPVVSILPGTFFGQRDYFIGNAIYILRLYNNAMPGYVNTGNPLCHVKDVVRGHLLGLEKGKEGERYIINGKDEDNRNMGDMLKIIAETIKELEPGKKIKTNLKEIPFRIVYFGARLAELWAGLTKTPCLLSRSAVTAGKIISYYSHDKATKEIGYEPQFSFKDAVKECFVYLKENDMLGIKGRRV